MSSCISMAARVGIVTLAAIKPVTRHYSGQKITLIIPRRLCHRTRSSLYEHACEGYSDKPDLDMTAVCAETDKVIANVENRKGELRGDDVRKIVSVV